MIRYLMWLGCFLLVAAESVCGQSYDTLRVATYNILNYPGSDGNVRDPQFRRIVQAIDPDILVVQEMISAAGVTEFLDNVLNAGQPGTYAAAPFVNGPDTDNAMFYKVSRVGFIGPQTVLHTALRDINGYRLRPAGIAADSLDIQIYSAHLKASQGFEPERAAEAETLRTHLNALPEGFFVGAGDFNLYTSTEPAYQNLIGSRPDNSGRLYDPINTSGSWHSNATFAAIHTQATRADLGGMDDRFDFALLAHPFQTSAGWQYISGSYTEYGNDGAHFNLSINDGVNGAVPDSIADALYAVSDHLPVFLDVRRQTQPAALVTLITPNGGETWYTGTSRLISWNSQNLTGTITLQLNRNYPGGGWETLFAGTANDGTQAWTVSGAVTNVARVKVVSDAQPAVSDISDANFSLQVATITVLRPSGGETFRVCTTDTLRWSSAGVSGNVRVELNRNYSGGVWETILTNTANDGWELWPVSAPGATQARVRITSIENSAASGTSAANFTLLPTAPPVLAHDPHGDTEPGAVTFTALAGDDCGDVTVKLLFGLAGGALDSVSMTHTGNPGECATSLSLGEGCWTYLMRATDSEGQVTATDSCELWVTQPCGVWLSYDDGSAEQYNWAPDEGFAWGVRFSPPAIPFVVCAAEVGIAGFHPDSAHSPIRVQVRAADGPGSMPGTILRDVLRGSIGNLVGGLPAPGMYLATASLNDEAGQPVMVNGDFYLTVQNSGGFEAFAIDASSPNRGRSVVFDACAGQWYPEDGIHPNSRSGNRVLRARGWAAQPSQVVVWKSGNDIQLSWSPNGAPYYRIYRLAAGSPGAPELVGSSGTTTWVLPGEVNLYPRCTYHVTASSTP